MTKQEFLAMSLPYGLHCSFLYDNEDIQGSIIFGMEFTVDGEYSSEKPLVFIDEFGEYRFDIIKPILHPLSDLTKWIEHKGEKFVPIEEILNYPLSYYDDKEDALISIQNYTAQIRWWTVQILIEWHFDIADLISKGEAIDVNTLEVNPYK